LLEDWNSSDLSSKELKDSGSKLSLFINLSWIG
ncbi:unnamed protein product, partial [Cuscuta campestris]